MPFPRLAGMFPDMRGLQAQFDEKFGELVDHLVQINATLGEILAELRKPEAAP